MSDVAIDLGGRPPFEPSPEQRQMVQILRANGISVEAIARSIGVSTPTLRKYFKIELLHGYEHVKGAMGHTLVKEGLKGNVSAICFWLARQGGEEWRLKEKHEFGFTASAGGQANVVPLLVLQPVFPNNIASNEHSGRTIDHIPAPVADED